MESTLEMDRNAVRHKKLKCLREKNRAEGSEVWDSEVKELAVVRLQQQQIESMELRMQELLPVEAKMRRIGSRSLRDKHRSRERQIEKLRSRDTAWQQTVNVMQKALQAAQEELQGNAQKVVDIQKMSASGKHK